MRILHVVNISFVIPFFLGEQLIYFTEKGNEEYIACSPSEDLPRYANLYKFRYTEVEITRQISLVKDVKAIYHIWKFIKQNKIDIVVGHTPKGGMCAMIASFLAGTQRRIYFRHGLVYETSHGIKRFILKSVDRITSLLATRIVCVSKSVAQKSIEDGLNKANKQVILNRGTCNGIDVNRFDPSHINPSTRAQLLAKYNITPNQFVIGYVGRLVRDKGIKELVDAFEIVHQKYPQTRLLLIGMLEKRDALDADTVQKINTHPGITCTGRIANEEIQNFYSLMNIFVLPSYREGFPTSVLEASAMKLPVLTTRATGCIESIIDHQTGLFINHDAQDIANHMIELIQDKDLYHHLAESGREFVIQNFTPELIWQAIEKLYKS